MFPSLHKVSQSLLDNLNSFFCKPWYDTKIKLSGNSDSCSDECCSPDASPKQELKEKIQERYGKIALNGNSESCCMPECCSPDSSPKQTLLAIGYDKDELESIPESSILGVGCGAPLKFC